MSTKVNNFKCPFLSILPAGANNYNRFQFLSKKPYYLTIFF